MSRDKQIEEMARALGEGRSQNCSHYVCCSACPCDFCCIFQENAHILVQEGYHKASDLAEEIFAEIEKLIIRRMIADSPLIDDRLITDVAELKKKYTEEGK